MSSERAQALARRQQHLLRRSGELRERFAAELAPWKQPLALADRVRALAGAGWFWLRGHPELTLGAAALLVLLRPRRAFALAWWGWRLWQRLRRSSLLSTRS